MPRPTNLIAFDDHLTEAYGPKGSPERDEFEAEVELAVIGETIRRIRSSQGLSQSELGERLGVGKAQISKLENNVKDARLSTIERVFQALGMKSRIKIELDPV